MPVVGKTAGPVKYPSRCLDPKWNHTAAWLYCRTPWNLWKKLHTLWQCQYCGTVFRLEKCRGMDDYTFRQWNRWEGKI